MSDQRGSYDERRETLAPCDCGRAVSNPTACASTAVRDGRCLLGERDKQIAGIAERQRARREGEP